MQQPKVTVIIPCRNEAIFISGVLNNLISQDYPKELLEVFVVDGMSSDKTADIIKSYAKRYPFIVYLENENKIVPYGLNKAIRRSTGEVIIRMDAHSLYPEYYISRLVYHLFSLNADNVGGVWVTVPCNNSTVAFAIAKASSCSFGIGNAMYRLGYERITEVDTVPFGCYRKEVFSKIGLFDTDLVRNQDDEFNARLIQNGGKIYLIPDVQIRYFARETPKKIIKMFYQYGFFKPLVYQKLKKPATLRQFAPLLFVVYLLSFWFTVFINNFLFKTCILFFLIYLVLSFFYSARITIKNKKIVLLFFLPYIFFLIHFSYGWGYLMGIIRFWILKKKRRKPLVI
ncbi:MAG: hypothetical protein COX07_06790 [Bacteroidetes bacterium CG23_combo_of_CG06-09_8_20_14_all_32_9]|nr:MAG: hypothetical protein COX07_06790 [Bacteroidetes bacterium CG23_combo_of_CG06-09_8_20_14_all_32_9]